MVGLKIKIHAINWKFLHYQPPALLQHRRFQLRISSTWRFLRRICLCLFHPIRNKIHLLSLNSVLISSTLCRYQDNCESLFTSNPSLRLLYASQYRTCVFSSISVWQESQRKFSSLYSLFCLKLIFASNISTLKRNIVLKF